MPDTKPNALPLLRALNTKTTIPMKPSYSITVPAIAALLALTNSWAHAEIDHLAVPSFYDNAEYFDGDRPGQNYYYGQTFIATDPSVTGVKLYIGDPSRPNVSEVNELSGPAELVLYDATNLLSPVELGRSLVVANAQSVQGLVTFSFTSPIPTTVGSMYFFSIRSQRMTTAWVFVTGLPPTRTVPRPLLTRIHQPSWKSIRAAATPPLPFLSPSPRPRFFYCPPPFVCGVADDTKPSCDRRRFEVASSQQTQGALHTSPREVSEESKI